KVSKLVKSLQHGVWERNPWCTHTGFHDAANGSINSTRPSWAKHVQGSMGQFHLPNNVRPDCVVYIVIDVGNGVGKFDDLAFEGRGRGDGYAGKTMSRLAMRADPIEYLRR